MGLVASPNLHLGIVFLIMLCDAGATVLHCSAPSGRAAGAPPLSFFFFARMRALALRLLDVKKAFF